MSGFRRRLMMAAVQEEEIILPSGYTRLNAIKGSTYNARINTGIQYQDGLEVECEFKDNKWRSYGNIFGAYSSEAQNALRLIYTNTDNNKGYYCYWRASRSIIVEGLTKNEVHHVIANKTSITIDGNTTTNSNPTEGTANSGNIFINGFDNSTQGTAGENRIITWYSFSIKKNGNYLFRGIPCKRNSDNKIGMYDLASRSFVTNSTTGTFTAV